MDTYRHACLHTCSESWPRVGGHAQTAEDLASAHYDSARVPHHSGLAQSTLEQDCSLLCGQCCCCSPDCLVLAPSPEPCSARPRTFACTSGIDHGRSCDVYSPPPCTPHGRSLLCPCMRTLVAVPRCVQSISSRLEDPRTHSRPTAARTRGTKTRTRPSRPRRCSPL